MATEKATDTTATQNPAPNSPKTPARARATRAKTPAKTSDTPPEAAITTASATATAASPARKSPRARATKKSQPAKAAAQAVGIEAEVLGEAAAVESALLSRESSKSLSQAQASPAVAKAPKAHCGQCGREMRFVPFTLSNLMCRSCYGLDRYRRPASPSLSSLTAPRPSGPR